MKNKNSPHILIIDDDIELLDLLGSYLGQRGYIISRFKNAEEGLVQIETKKIVPDLVICDLKLPMMSGLEFIHRLNKNQSQIPVILMTSEGSVEVAVEAISHGAFDFSLKPLHFPQLLITIQRCLHNPSQSRETEEIQQFERDVLSGIVGKSPGFLHAINMARRVSNSNANILIKGESGSGKEIIARAVHEFGDKRSGPFIPINCTAIPENLLESELFGHAKGSFTGAHDKKTGLFEEANKGTLFLDEIGDLSLSLQAKLLRVLQERKIKRIGENHYRDISARIICATHKDLRKEVAEGKFREDLYFRLNVIPISMPPLRQRKDDILPLSEFFLKKYASLNFSKVRGFEHESIKKLEEHLWRGNVRELENAIERAVVLSNDDYIKPEDLELEGNVMFTDDKIATIENYYDEIKSNSMSLEELSKKYIRFIFDKNRGAKEQTAKDLGIDRKTLYRKLKEMNLEGTA